MMTEDQFQEALRLRDNHGYGFRRAADAVGVTRGVFFGEVKRRGLCRGRGEPSCRLSDEQIAVAVKRHRAGESWDAVAASFGVGRTTVMRRVDALNARDALKSAGVSGRGTYSAACVEVWQKRPVRKVIKPPAEVRELTRLFAAGKISRAELCHMIRA